MVSLVTFTRRGYRYAEMSALHRITRNEMNALIDPLLVR